MCNSEPVGFVVANMNGSDFSCYAWMCLFLVLPLCFSVCFFVLRIFVPVLVCMYDVRLTCVRAACVKVQTYFDCLPVVVCMLCHFRMPTSWCVSFVTVCKCLFIICIWALYVQRSA